MFQPLTKCFRFLSVLPLTGICFSFFYYCFFCLLRLFPFLFQSCLIPWLSFCFWFSSAYGMYLAFIVPGPVLLLRSTCFCSLAWSFLYPISFSSPQIHLEFLRHLSAPFCILFLFLLLHSSVLPLLPFWACVPVVPGTVETFIAGEKSCKAGYTGRTPGEFQMQLIKYFIYSKKRYSKKLLVLVLTFCGIFTTNLILKKTFPFTKIYCVLNWKDIWWRVRELACAAPPPGATTVHNRSATTSLPGLFSIICWH